MTGIGRLCCKSPKLQEGEIFRQNPKREASPIRMASLALPKSPVLQHNRPITSISQLGPSPLLVEPDMTAGTTLFVSTDVFFGSRRGQFATLTARDRIPAIYSNREYVAAGGLMSYGTNFADMWYQVGVYAGLILKGAKTTDLPVVQSTKFEFLINLQTARALGIEVPPPLLAIADEVIE
jgi:hypothetical protein